MGDLEVLDLDAAVAWARLLGYGRIVAVGWSMGAGVAVRHAALVRDEPLGEGRVDAVVAVSGPSRWYYRGTPPMRWLHRGIGTRVGRGVMALGFSTRIAASGWDPWPEPPDALAARVAPTPLLLVHGDRDRYFPLEHARWLAHAAGPTAELWIEPGMGHAEAGATPALLHRVARSARRPPRLPGCRGEGRRRGSGVRRPGGPRRRVGLFGARNWFCPASSVGLLDCCDAAGVRIVPSPIVMPPTPPPDVDVEAWDATLDEIERRAPERLALIHFGIFDDVERHLGDLRERLHRFAALVGNGATEDQFVDEAHAVLGGEAPDYDNAFPPQQDYEGLTRYWTKRRDAGGV